MLFRQGEWTVPRRGSLLIAGALVLVGAGAVYVTTRLTPERVVITADPGELGENLGIGPAIPPLRARGWLNTEGFDRAALESRVVLFDFWTYSSVNCQRTIPWLRSWYERYGPDGLVIVGVHSPEFTFERDHANVARASEELGVTWPVALDDGRDIWDAFENRYWPAMYVFDRDSRLRFTHFGEGAYERTEDVLRALLDVPDDAPRAAPVEGADTVFSAHQTPEVHLGSDRGAAMFLSPEELSSGTRRYSAPDPFDVEGAALTGRWKISGEYAESAAGKPAALVSYVAAEANAVLGGAGDGPVDTVVQLDGVPVPEAMRGRDLIVDAEGRTVVRVERPGLYRLVRGAPVDHHVLRLEPAAPGMRAYAFSFGG